MSESAFREAMKERIRIANRAIMRSRGINYTQLAEQLRVGASALSNWETRAKLSLPGPYRLFLYSTVFGISLDWLYKGDTSTLRVDMMKLIKQIERERR